MNIDLYDIIIIVLLTLIIYLLYLRNKALKKSTDQSKTTIDMNYTIQPPIEKIFQGEDINPPRKKIDISIHTISDITEYRVFKELGYIDQAIESLEQLIEKGDSYKQPELINELALLYIETQRLDSLLNLLEEEYKLLKQEKLQYILSKALNIDSQHDRLNKFINHHLN